MNDHLAKPVDPDRLYATVERWIPAQDAGSLAATARAGPRGDARDRAMRTLLGDDFTPARRTVPDAAGSEAASAQHRPWRAPATGDATEAIVARIDGVAGVDAAAWQAGSAAMRSTYIALLGRFLGGHADDGAAIRKAARAGDRSAAARRARTLENVADSLGLVHVTAAAREVRAVLEAGGAEPALSAAIATLDDVLGAVLAGLRAAGVTPVLDRGVGG
jgi:HPt (histidine-containing phosphotransfer) domain-containing protein